MLYIIYGFTAFLENIASLRIYNCFRDFDLGRPRRGIKKRAHAQLVKYLASDKLFLPYNELKKTCLVTKFLCINLFYNFYPFIELS